MDDIQQVINDKEKYFIKAIESGRKRYAYVLHKPGDYHNRVLNFLISTTYMKTHLHEGSERSEFIKILEGEIKVIYFNSVGIPFEEKILSTSTEKSFEIIVPPGVWHTYTVMSKRAITYETMNGVYDPNTWKKMADWAPNEGSEEAGAYEHQLRNS